MSSKVTLSRAAEISGLSKSRIHRALKTEGSGRISAERDEAGQYQIDLSEFERVFPRSNWPSQNDTGERRGSGRSAPPFQNASDDVLQVKLEAAEEMLDQIRDTLDRERERADRAEAERRALLEAPNSEAMRERDERQRERLEAEKRDAERRAEIERLRAELDAEREERKKEQHENSMIEKERQINRGVLSRLFRKG